MAEQKQEGGQDPTPKEETKSRFDTYREKIAAGEKVFTAEAAEDLPSVKEARELGKEPPTGDPDDAEPVDPPAPDPVEEPEDVVDDDAAADPEGEEAEEEEEAEAGADGEYVVELPGRNDGELVEFVAPDQETADHLNRLRKGYLRREQLATEQRKLQDQWDEITEIDDRLATDPVSFFTEKTPAEHKVAVAMALLLEEDVFTAVQKQLDDIEDPEKREVMRLRSEKQRRELKEKSTADRQRVNSAKAAVQKIGDNIQGLVPDGMPAERATKFVVAAMNVAEELTGRLGRLNLTEGELVTALEHEGLLTRFDIEPGAAPAGKKKAAAGTRKGAQVPPSKKAAGTGAARTPEGLKKASLRRRSVAGSASSGAGAPGATVELSRTASVKDRIAEVRKKGLSSVLSGKS